MLSKLKSSIRFDPPMAFSLSLPSKSQLVVEAPFAPLQTYTLSVSASADVLDGLKLPLLASSVTLTTAALPAYFDIPWDTPYAYDGVYQFPSDFNGDFAIRQSGDPKQDGFYGTGAPGSPPIPPKTISFTAVTMANLPDVIANKYSSSLLTKPDTTIVAQQSDPMLRNFSIDTLLASSGLVAWTTQTQPSYQQTGLIARSDLGVSTVFASKALNVFVWDTNSLSPLAEQAEVIVYRLRTQYAWQCLNGHSRLSLGRRAFAGGTAAYVQVRYHSR
jgi:hypothetical protein